MGTSSRPRGSPVWAARSMAAEADGRRHRWCAAQPKPRRPNHASVCFDGGQLHQGHAGHFVDYVDAPDAKTAEDIAAKEHRIPDTLRDRLVAIREAVRWLRQRLSPHRWWITD